MENGKLKIGVAGLGLIGGSILKALFNKGFHMTAVSKSQSSLAEKYCNIIASSYEVLKDCDVVFVCSKMKDTVSVLDELENIVRQDCIVTDVCSLKRFVNKKERPYNFVSSHPMAGTEFSGFEHSFTELFCGATWILTKQNDVLENLIKEMGAKPLILNETTHDKMACLISHLPMLISSALFKTAYEEDINSLKIASSGFRDTTRLSLTNPDLAYDMLSLNKDNFELYIDKFIENLKSLKEMDKDEFYKTLCLLQSSRGSMYDENGKNKL